MQMIFDRKIRYDGREYLPYVPIEIPANDASAAKKLGAYGIDAGTVVNRQGAKKNGTKGARTGDQ